MICSEILQVPPSSYHVPTRVVSRPKYSDASIFLRRSNRSKMGIRAQEDSNHVPNGTLGGQNHPRKITGLSAATTLSLADNLKFWQQSCNGIGIAEFLEGKNYFVTGATGLLAKAFVEKILRMSPNVGKIYLLIRAENEKIALGRLISEIIECEVFQHLRQRYGAAAYEKFMLSKLIPVVGDIIEPNLGIRSVEMMNQIMEEVDVIVHSAANTAFDDRYDATLKMNVSGTSRMLELAKHCKKLRVFLHVSTAFVHGTREGLLLEELSESRQAPLDVDEEIKLALDMAETLPKNEVSLKMREVGMTRAKSYGFKNTYELSKAMGEMAIHRSRGKLPVVIVRPSVVESTYQEPFPGWIQGNKVLEPVVIWYGKGQLPGMIAYPEAVLDVVPLDVVVNAMVAAMAKHGKSTDSGLFTYHITSSTVNPLTVINLYKCLHSHFALAPLVDANGDEIRIEEMKFLDSIEEFQSLTEKAILRNDTNNENRSSDRKKNKWIVENITQLGRLYEPYFFNKARFDNSNTDKLFKEMSTKERLDFPMDMRSIDWEHYFVNIHIPGVRKHVMKKPMKSHNNA